MKQIVIKMIINMCAKSIFLTAMIGVIIGIVGFINKWNSSIAYSNAFFLAGSLVIIAGASSRLGAGQELNNSQGLYAESFRDMSPGERATFMINASSSVHLLILSLLSGILLILISVLVWYCFA